MGEANPISGDPVRVADIVSQRLSISHIPSYLPPAYESALSRELDAKKKLLDGVETSVQKMSQTKLAWKTKLTMKDDEISDLRVS